MALEAREVDHLNGVTPDALGWQPATSKLTVRQQLALLKPMLAKKLNDEFGYDKRNDVFCMVSDKYVDKYAYHFALTGDKQYALSMTRSDLDKLSYQARLNFAYRVSNHPRTKKLVAEYQAKFEQQRVDRMANTARDLRAIVQYALTPVIRDGEAVIRDPELALKALEIELKFYGGAEEYAKKMLADGVGREELLPPDEYERQAREPGAGSLLPDGFK